MAGNQGGTSDKPRWVGVLEGRGQVCTDRRIWRIGPKDFVLSIHQLVVTDKSHALSLQVDSLRRMQRSVSDVCLGVDERGGDMCAIFISPGLRDHRSCCRRTEKRVPDGVHDLGASLWVGVGRLPWVTSQMCHRDRSRHGANLGEQFQITFQC